MVHIIQARGTICERSSGRAGRRRCIRIGTCGAELDHLLCSLTGAEVRRVHVNPCGSCTALSCGSRYGLVSADPPARRRVRHPHRSRAPGPMGPRPVVLPAVQPRALASCSTVRQEDATDSQPCVTTGPAGQRRPQAPACSTAPPAASRVLPTDSCINNAMGRSKKGKLGLLDAGAQDWPKAASRTGGPMISTSCSLISLRRSRGSLAHPH